MVNYEKLVDEKKMNSILEIFSYLDLAFYLNAEEEFKQLLSILRAIFLHFKGKDTSIAHFNAMFHYVINSKGTLQDIAKSLWEEFEFELVVKEFGLLRKRLSVEKYTDLPIKSCDRMGVIFPTNNKRRRFTKAKVFVIKKKNERAILRRTEGSPSSMLRRKKGTPSLPGWSDLPDHLLELIMKKFSLTEDLIRFGAVCVSWKHAVGHNRPSLPRQLPMLMVPDHRDIRSFSFHNLFAIKGRRTYKLELQIPHNSRCIGSTEGWLVFEGQGQDCRSSIRLVNPFLSVDNEIRLPLLSRTITEPWAPTIRKVVLSANPASNSDYVVMALYGSISTLVFWRPGDEAWTGIDYSSIFEDFIYHRDQFHTIDSVGEVLSWNITACPPVEKPVGYVFVKGGAIFKNYLVESSGELLVLARSIHHVSSLTVGFKIYKKDLITRLYNEVKNLCSGSIFFVGGVSSMSLVASHFPATRSNCIYFGFDDIHENPEIGPFDTGVFMIEDGHVGRIFPPKCRLSPIWVELKPKGF